MQQYVPLLTNVSVKPLENAFFTNKKMQLKIEVKFINRTKFIILFVKEKKLLKSVASFITITATDLKLLQQCNSRVNYHK